MAARMHENELDIDEALVRRLLHGQFPRWANLPLQELPRAGTDNALFRLGEEMVVRLPRIDWAAGQAEKDHHWLSRLAPHLPLAVPVLVFGAGAVEAHQSGLSAQAHLSLLGAGLILAWLAGPVVTALAVRIAHE